MNSWQLIVSQLDRPVSVPQHNPGGDNSRREKNIAKGEATRQQVIDYIRNNKHCTSEDIAMSVDLTRNRIGVICRKLLEDGIISKTKAGNIYWSFNDEKAL